MNDKIETERVTPGGVRIFTVSDLMKELSKYPKKRMVVVDGKYGSYRGISKDNIGKIRITLDFWGPDSTFSDAPHAGFSELTAPAKKTRGFMNALVISRYPIPNQDGE